MTGYLPARPVTRLAAMLLAVAALSGCVGASALGQATPVAVSASEAARRVSVFRAANGLPPVHSDARLTAIAAAHAVAMGRRDALSHRIGGSLPKRLSAENYRWVAAAENIGAGYPTLEAAMEGWEQSAGHRKNLLNRAVTEIGIGAAATPPGSKYHTYWSLILAAPRS